MRRQFGGEKTVQVLGSLVGASLKEFGQNCAAGLQRADIECRWRNHVQQREGGMKVIGQGLGAARGAHRALGKVYRNQNSREGSHDHTS